MSLWSPIAKIQRRLELGDPARVGLSRALRLARAALVAVGEGRDPASSGLCGAAVHRRTP